MPRTKEQIESELLALRAAGGDADALDSLLRLWQSRLWRYLRGLCGDDQTAWDLLQETCLSIAASITRLKKREAFAAIAYQIAYRRYVDWVRSDKRKRELTEQAAAETQSQSGDDDNDGERDLIREAVAKLQDLDRSIITLAYLEGYAYAEISKLLNLPLGTVKSRIHYAKERIRLAIEKETS